MTLEVIRKRLRAAEVKSHESSLSKDATINVDIHRHFSYAWYRTLMLSPGRFSIRPRIRGGINWLDLAKELPKGVEIHSDKQNATRTFLWSSSHKQLSETMKRFHFKNVEAVIGPDGTDGGWRTYTVGPSTLTESDVERAKREVSSSGVNYVRIQLRSSSADRLAAAGNSNVEQWLVVLDEEVLGPVQNAVLSTGRLQLTAPKRASSRREQKSWALQVVGRLAAPLPITVAVVQE